MDKRSCYRSSFIYKIFLFQIFSEIQKYYLRKVSVLWDKIFLTENRNIPLPFSCIDIFVAQFFLKFGKVRLRMFSALWDKNCWLGKSCYPVSCTYFRSQCGIVVCRRPSKSKFKTVVFFSAVCKNWSNYLKLGEKYAGSSRPSWSLFFQFLQKETTALQLHSSNPCTRHLTYSSRDAISDNKTTRVEIQKEHWNHRLSFMVANEDMKYIHCTMKKIGCYDIHKTFHWMVQFRVLMASYSHFMTQLIAKFAQIVLFLEVVFLFIWGPCRVASRTFNSCVCWDPRGSGFSTEWRSGVRSMGMETRPWSSPGWVVLD